MAWHARIDHDFGCVSLSWLGVHERVTAWVIKDYIQISFIVGCSKKVSVLLPSANVIHITSKELGFPLF
nr:hypothetical protein CFP56_41641 [Quercus suber]